MGILNKMVSFFMEEETPKTEQTKKSNDQTNKSATILKNMFTKTDPFVLTEFPYNWEKDFFPPLDDKEKKYMRTEIMRWYAIYYETNSTLLVETLVEGALEHDKISYHLEETRPEEFRMLIRDTMEEHFLTKSNDRIQRYDGSQLIHWKPVYGQTSWEPPTGEFLDILTELLDVIRQQVTVYLQKQMELEALLKKMKGQTVPISARAKGISDYVVSFMDKNRNEIMRHAVDRMILELNAFPSYYGHYEKEFRNDLFKKYHKDFGVYSYNELVAASVSHIQPFLQANGKMELKRWYYNQWDEFRDFVQNEYLHKNEEELENVHSSELNPFALAIDFYALTLFKLYLDGM